MKFRGEFGFLSNFYPSKVKLDGKLYPTVEHAFQAAKTLDEEEREKIRRTKTPGEAKKLGRKVKLRADWTKVRVKVMCKLLLQKFSSDQMKKRLLKVNEKEIVEDNYWHDNFWGICRCNRCGGREGKNTLGVILTNIRDMG